MSYGIEENNEGARTQALESDPNHANKVKYSNPPTPFVVALLAGGIAGTSVDIALFPIDTIKTRLQSPQGFLQSGGFRGIYRGVGAAAIGSAPGASIFFCTYESLKPMFGSVFKESPSLSHVVSAVIGEVMACLVRVPTEVIKTKMQTNSKGAHNVYSTLQLVLAEKNTSTGTLNIFGGLYRGFGITLMREIPFAFVQFPIYEYLKTKGSQYQNNTPVSPLQSAACGSVGGGIAAAITTPLDVVKTRLMLGTDKNGVIYNGAIDVARRGLREDGLSAFFRGIQPRVMWISIGGFVFFGMYEAAKNSLLYLV